MSLVFSSDETSGTFGVSGTVSMLLGACFLLLFKKKKARTKAMMATPAMAPMAIPAMAPPLRPELEFEPEPELEFEPEPELELELVEVVSLVDTVPCWLKNAAIPLLLNPFEGVVMVAFPDALGQVSSPLSYSLRYLELTRHR